MRIRNENGVIMVGGIIVMAIVAGLFLNAGLKGDLKKPGSGKVISLDKDK